MLNYPGSKKKLLEFIHTHAAPYIAPGDPVLDIFSGTCSVGYSFKREHPVYANDSETYAYIISKALLGDCRGLSLLQLKERVEEGFEHNRDLLLSGRTRDAARETELLAQENLEGLISLEGTLPTVFRDEALFRREHPCHELFTLYYAGTYFSLRQAMEIDSLRCAIETFAGQPAFYVLMTSLFFAMKECVFSKDGHMAQPLNPVKNGKKLLTVRRKSIITCFWDKLSAFFEDTFVLPAYENRAYHGTFEEVLQLPEIARDIRLIYADPPYTDMQYSRYFHLLNTVADYRYLLPTKTAAGYTKGLYLEGRFQSKLSSKSTCLESFEALIAFAAGHRKHLAVSFAYPRDTERQKTNRYVMNIDSLFTCCREAYGANRVELAKMDYTHSNNRNSKAKQVLEYLILCRGDH